MNPYDFSKTDYLAGAIGVLLEKASGIETASFAFNEDIDNRIKPLADSVLIENVTEAEVAYLKERGVEIIVAGTLAVASLPIEVAAGKSKAKKKANDAKRNVAESAKLKHMRDKGALNIVKKLFNQYVGAEEDYTMFVSFFRDFDNLIDEYRALCGVNEEEAPADEDDEEADDVDESDTVASVETPSAADQALANAQQENASMEDSLQAMVELEEEVAAAEKEDRALRVLTREQMQDNEDSAVLQQ